MIDRPADLTAEDLLAVVRRYHPAGALDLDPGYDRLPEVQARRAVQREAAGAAAWADLLADLRTLWPTGEVMDCSTLHLDIARHVRVMPDRATPGHHLVAWVSLLAPVALVYESRQHIGERAVVTPADQASDAAGIRRLMDAVIARGWQVLSEPIATRPVPGVAVLNLLPGEATLADCLFSDARW